MTSSIIHPNTIPELHIFGEPRLRTDGQLLALAFAPDGTLLSMEEPGGLRRWQPSTGHQLAWHSLSDLETLWTFSRDGRVLASASNDLSIWDTSSGQLLTAWAQPSWVTALTLAADSTFLVTGHDDGVLRLWDAGGHRLLRELRGHKRPISAVAFDPQGTLLASAGEDKTICLWNVREGKLLGTWQGHTDRIPALAWHPGGVYLVSAGWDTTARIWDTRSLQPVILLNDHAQQVTALAFSGDGQKLATADSERVVRLWDFETKKVLRQFTGPDSDIPYLAFSPNGAMLAASGECQIHLWDIATGQVLAGPAAPRQRPGLVRLNTSLAIHPHGTTLAVSGVGSVLRLWDLASRKALPPVEDDDLIHAVAFNAPGKVMATAAGSHVRLWDVTTGRSLGDLTGPEEPITRLAFAPDGQTLATASSAGLAVWLWSLANREPILLIPDALDNCTIEALAFHPQGRLLAVAGIDWLATGGSDGAVSLWDLEERCEVATFGGGSLAVAFHPNGQILASAALDSSIHLLAPQESEAIAELGGHDGAVTCLAYSADGKWLASGGEDRTLRLWDEDGHETALVELDSQIHGLAFSPDGRFLFTANANTTCYQLEVRHILDFSR